MATTARRATRSLRWLALPAAIIVFATGVWVAGGVVTDSFRASMALVALWYAVAAMATLVIARRRHGLAVPLIAGYLLGAAGIAVVLAAATLRDRVADERVVAGTPASQVPDAGRPLAVTELTGDFVPGEHATRGTASVVRTARGRRVLTLTGFATSAGPDLRVRILPGAGTDGAARESVDVGALKGNRGDQQYRLPAGVGAGGSTVVVWCRAFSALFGSARLRPA